MIGDPLPPASRWHSSFTTLSPDRYFSCWCNGVWFPVSPSPLIGRWIHGWLIEHSVKARPLTHLTVSSTCMYEYCSSIPPTLKYKDMLHRHWTPVPSILTPRSTLVWRKYPCCEGTACPFFLEVAYFLSVSPWLCPKFYFLVKIDIYDRWMRSRQNRSCCARDQR